MAADKPALETVEPQMTDHLKQKKGGSKDLSASGAEKNIRKRKKMLDDALKY